MAFLGITVPFSIPTMLPEKAPSRENTEMVVRLNKLLSSPVIDFPHITIVIFGKDLASSAIGRLLDPILEATSGMQPFEVSTSRITVFEPKGDSTPLISLIDSQDLHWLHKRVREACDEEGIEYAKTFAEYRPHTTLEYLGKEAYANWEGDILFPPISWRVSEIKLFGGDEGAERLVVTFPLGAPRTKEASWRAFVRVTQRW